MSKVIEAIFEDGIFKPLDKVDFLDTKWVKLRVEPIGKNEEPIRLWAKNLIQNVSGNQKRDLDAEFAQGLSIRQYFAMNEEQREKLWEKWYQESERKGENIEAVEIKIE